MQCGSEFGRQRQSRGDRGTPLVLVNDKEAEEVGGNKPRVERMKEMYATEQG